MVANHLNSVTYIYLYILHSKKHRVPPNRSLFLNCSSSWQLLMVTQKFALEQNFHVQASRYFVCMFHQVDISTWIKMWFLQCRFNKSFFSVCFVIESSLDLMKHVNHSEWEDSLTRGLFCWGRGSIDFAIVCQSIHHK